MRDRKNDTDHRHAAVRKLGRALRPDEVVDHLNENKSENAASNLAVVPRGQHTAQHNRARGLSKLRSALRMPAERRKLY